MEPATKNDLKELASELKQWLLDREVTSIRWFVGVFVGVQIAYFAVTLGAMYFIASHVHG